MYSVILMSMMDGYKGEIYIKTWISWFLNGGEPVKNTEETKREKKPI